MKRLFVAIKIYPEGLLLKSIADFRRSLAKEKINWINIDNIHLTLAFIGDTEADRINVLSTLLMKKCSKSGQFDLTLKGAGIFKNINDPRVIWIGIEPSENLTRLHEIIINTLTGCGIFPENRLFSPHITLGRIKKISEIADLEKLLKYYYGIVLQRAHINEVILYESIFNRSGAFYKPLLKVNL
jgi:RNA 2',3'-cyclic 3'-phosphodiesterase